MNTNNTFSMNYLKYILIIFFTATIMYFGKVLLIPLSFGLLIALILYPFCNWLEKHKWPRSITIIISLTIISILFLGIIWLLLWQMSFIKDDIPFLVEKIQTALQQFQTWFEKNIGVVLGLNTNWLKNLSLNSGESMSSIVTIFLKSMGSFLFSLFIIPVFTSLFLYNREQFVSFLKSMVAEKYHPRLSIILHKTSYAYFNYIIGLIKVYLIVGVLNSIGLLLLGINHAILFGMLTAFMTMIPYAGIIVSALLPITVAWVTKDSILYPIGVVAVFAFVQYLENSIIFPKVVGMQLNVSTWIILVALLAGGIIWGISGMILFMPFAAILKIISEYIEDWKPLNILLSR